jgi:hypothetical protein
MTIRDVLTQENLSALTYSEQYDTALLAWTHGLGTRPDIRSAAVYSWEKLVEIVGQDFAEDVNFVSMNS